MHQIVKAERQGREHRGLERDHRRRHKQLLERAKPQLPIERSEHLLLGHHNVAHHAAVVKQTVVLAVARIEIDLDGHHKVDGRDEDGQKGDERRNVVVGRAVKQPLDLHTNRSCPNNDQVGKESQIGEEPCERKRHKLVEPMQKTPGAAVALRKIAVQQHDVPNEHDPVTQRNARKQALDGRQAQR